MEAQISQILVYLIGSGVVGLVVALAKLWADFNAYRLYMAEKYTSKEDLDEIKDDLKQLRDVVYRVALKLEVPVFTEKWRG
jgi:flagellar biosynthesis/type III secretory pathway M-ring protein FliF/YscJ